MNPYNRIPLLLGHIDEHAVPQNAGIIYEDIKSAELFDRRVNKILSSMPIRYVVVIRHSRPPGRLNLRDHRLRQVPAVPAAVHRRADIVDNDYCALRGELESLLPSNALPSASDRLNA